MWSADIDRDLAQITSDLQAVDGKTNGLASSVAAHESKLHQLYYLNTAVRRIARSISRRLQDCEIGITQPYFATLLLQRFNFQAATASMLPGAVVPTAPPEILNAATAPADLSKCDVIANDEFAFRMPAKVKDYFPAMLRFSFAMACTKNAVVPYVSRRASLRITPQGEGSLVESVQAAVDTALAAQISNGQFPLTNTSFDRFQLELLGTESGGHVSMFGLMVDTALGPQARNPRAADIGQMAEPPWPAQSELAFRMKTPSAMPILKAKLFAEAQKQIAGQQGIRLIGVDVDLGPVPNSLSFHVHVTYHFHCCEHRRYGFFGPEDSVDEDIPIVAHFLRISHGNRRALYRRHTASKVPLD